VRAVQFYGNQCFHYNRVNRGGRTRVSFDFRVIPLSEYRDDVDVKCSVQSSRRFTIGDGEMDYYSTFDKRTGGKYEFPARSTSSSPATVDGETRDEPAVEALEYRV
jgi:hypothetical protein